MIADSPISSRGSAHRNWVAVLLIAAACLLLQVGGGLFDPALQLGALGLEPADPPAARRQQQEDGQGAERPLHQRALPPPGDHLDQQIGLIRRPVP